jgi:hypothetical protein
MMGGGKRDDGPKFEAGVEKRPSGWAKGRRRNERGPNNTTERLLIPPLHYCTHTHSTTTAGRREQARRESTQTKRGSFSLHVSARA